MSIQYDARISALKAYPKMCDEGVELFLSLCGVDRDDFYYEEGMPAEMYLYDGTNDL